MPIERVSIPSDDWLVERRLQFVGASEAPIAMGEGSWGSLAELFAEKKGRRPPRIDTGALRRGRYGEAAVFEALAHERIGWEFRRAKVHVEWPERRLACTPDGAAFRPDREDIGIIQAKVTARSIFRDDWLDDPKDSIQYGTFTPPASYRIQTLTEMMLNGCAWGVLAVLVNGEFDWTLRTFEIERNPVIEDRILHRVDAFWRDYFDLDIMPPYDPQRDAELIRQLYPKDDGTEIDLTTDNRALALVEEWSEIGTARKRLETAEKAIKTELCGKIGEHTYGRLSDGRRLSWKQQHRKEHTVAASDFRVLRIHAPSKED